ncbi:uncharacterized protein LOC141852617 [Brevipalpus obovatus]|uniref:uncharacterized protein LOC141852617 n=1 Tax=Brevipalpus obovatus TaxID=246614 RepID=UPI003D9E4B89
MQMIEPMEFEFSLDDGLHPHRSSIKRELDCHTTLSPADMPITNENLNRINQLTNSSSNGTCGDNLSTDRSDKSQSPRVTSSTEIFLVKRRPSMSFRCIESSASSSPAPVSVSKRNERERNRVKLVNMGFQTLRQHIPNGKGKLSKVQTLRSAVNYIRQLQSFLTDDGQEKS